MNAIVRPQPHTDALDTLGSIITTDEKRDAIHLAVIPVTSDYMLNPGDHVEHIADGKVQPAPIGCGHGIVDPFLEQRVMPGEPFWLVIYPRQIRSLRHVWTHPAFDNTEVAAALPDLRTHVRNEPLPTYPVEVLTAEPVVEGMEMQEAYDQLGEIASELGVSVDDLLERAHDYLRTGSYWSEGSRFEGEHIPARFWDAYEIVQQTTVAAHSRGSFLTCSC